MNPYDVEKATACANLNYEIERLQVLQASMSTTLGQMTECQQKIALYCTRLQEIERLEESESCHG